MGKRIPKAQMPPSHRDRTPKQLFEERMIYEGKYDEYLAADKLLREASRPGTKDSGQYTFQFWEMIKTNFGYVDVHDERERCLLRLERAHLKSRGDSRTKARHEKAVVKASRTFIETFRALPDTAPFDEQMEWIASHPVMLTRIRGESDSNIVLKPSDIESAPCRAAANHLQYWCNNYDAFFSETLKEMKKRKVSDDVEENVVEEEMMSLKESQMLLKSTKIAKKEKETLDGM